MEKESEELSINEIQSENLLATFLHFDEQSAHPPPSCS